ncbi:hypothetical protein KPB2_5479 [Klebsiella pneumoniae Kb677]|nr:hypothetical protein KPB2_5479 [Klebsiella pneumoniae Kb677]
MNHAFPLPLRVLFDMRTETLHSHNFIHGELSFYNIFKQSLIECHLIKTRLFPFHLCLIHPKP